MIDDGFLVPDSVRLNDAASELRSVFEISGLTESDRNHPAYAFYASLSLHHLDEHTKSDWLKRTVAGALSEKALERALVRGTLQIWTADATDGRPRDSQVLFAPNSCKWHDTFVTGRFIPVQSPSEEPTYFRQRLFIKMTEWIPWRDNIIVSRGGIAQELLTAIASRPDVSQGNQPRNVQLLGCLPSNATAANRRDEPYAHAAAKLVRSGKGLAEAIRCVAPEDPTREKTSVESAIRRTFALMYARDGSPLP